MDATLREENARLREALAYWIGNSLLNGAEIPRDLVDFAAPLVSRDERTPVEVTRAALQASSPDRTRRTVALATKPRSPHVSRENADLLAEVDFLVMEYAASDEPMTDGAVQLATVTRQYVRRWAVLCDMIPRAA